MRFNIALRVNAQKFGRILPLNYQYETSAAIYKILSSADNDFAAWLHDNGFQLPNNKQFKLFTFSRLQIPPKCFRLIKQSNQMELLSDRVSLQISFLPENSTETFIGGIFQNRVFEIGDRKSKVQFEVENIELMQPPAFKETMMYEALSPISVSHYDDNGRQSYPQSPDEFKNAPWIREVLLCNLLDKYAAVYGHEFEGNQFLDLMTLSEPKSCLVTIKSGTSEQTRVRGFMCKFALRTSPELQKIAYESGLGSGNSQGFGCLQVM